MRQAAPQTPGFGMLAAVLAVVLFGGIGAGLGLAEIFAPRSGIARALGLFMLPTALGIGMSAWYGVGSAAALARGVRASVRAQSAGALPAAAAGPDDPADEGPAGLYIFVVASLMVSGVGGVMFAFLSGENDFAAVFATVVLAGLGYGLLLRWLAARGLLPPPV